MPKYPDITVRLIGQDGNAFAVLSACHRAMQEADLPADVYTKFHEEATRGNYDHLLATAMDWFEII